LRSAKVTDLLAETFAFKAQKTLYGEKRIAKCDAIFVLPVKTKAGWVHRERRCHFL